MSIVYIDPNLKEMKLSLVPGFVQYWIVKDKKTMELDVFKFRTHPHDKQLEYYAFGNIGWFTYKHVEDRYQLVEKLIIIKDKEFLFSGVKEKMRGKIDLLRRDNMVKMDLLREYEQKHNEPIDMLKVLRSVIDGLRKENERLKERIEKFHVDDHNKWWVQEQEIEKLKKDKE
jgi:hypothetical protein